MDRPTIRPPKRWRRAFWPVAGVLSLVVVLAVVLAVRDGEDKAAQPSPSAGQRTPTALPTGRITSFAGAGSSLTPSFKVVTTWEIRWTAPAGSAFKIELFRADGTPRGGVVTAGKRVAGSTFITEVGEFKLRVSSNKPWTIQILSRPPAKEQDAGKQTRRPDLPDDAR